MPQAPNRAARPKPSPERPQWEIQIHPSDIQKGVRYLFWTPRQLRWIAAGLLAYLLVVGFGLYLLPGVIGSLLSRQEYRSLLATQAVLGERLDALKGQFEGLDHYSSELDLRMAKIYLAYGLTSDGGSIGQGGYPEPAAPDEGGAYAERVVATRALEAQLNERIGVLETFLREIHSFEEAHREQVASTPSMSPLEAADFVLTSPFGTRTNPFTKERDFHAGIDLAAPIGTPVYAPADGSVRFASRYPLRRSVSWWRYGNLVSIKNGDRFITLYGHLDTIAVKARQQVKQGDLIGTVGNTGWSTNPHLHYEVRRLDDDGTYRPVDPRIYILDHRWRDEERLLIRARSAPSARNYEPLPSLIRR